MDYLILTCARVVVAFAMLFLSGSWFCAFAQPVEQEPNDPCPAAQVLGAIPLPWALEGSLDTPPETPDVDFFAVSAAPGTSLVAELRGQSSGSGTLADPLLGAFDAACNLLALNDDFVSLDSRLIVTVPADGRLILAATSCCDDAFSGGGDSSGRYQLTLAPAPAAISAISGRVVDAFSGQPLPGDRPPFAFVELFRCSDDDCFDREFVNFQTLDNDGRFQFRQDFSGQPLPIGSYGVVALADEYEPFETEPFAVGEGEDAELGDIALIPPPITFSEIVPCERLLPQGGPCRYTLRITNATSAPLRALAWSLVDAFSLGSSLDFTTFEATAGSRGGARNSAITRRQHVVLTAASSATIGFQFDVPSFVRDGATFCTRVFLGLEPRPLVNTLREGGLFCITKGPGGFQLTDDSAGRTLLRAISNRDTIRRGSLTPKKR